MGYLISSLKIILSTEPFSLALSLSLSPTHTHTVSIAATNSEVSDRRNHRDTVHSSHIRNDAAVAILSKSTQDTDAKATLACVLPWGHGYGYSILPNGVWNGGE